MLKFDAATMSTGVVEVDDQHRELIKKLNELFDRMMKGEGADALKGLLDFLGQYAAWHFGREENCMDAYRCPAAASNKQAHAEFIRVFSGLKARLAAEGPTTKLVVETQQQLSTWLTAHIVRIDTKLKNCVHAA
jgi:hemerythrin